MKPSSFAACYLTHFSQPPSVHKKGLVEHIHINEVQNVHRIQWMRSLKLELASTYFFFFSTCLSQDLEILSRDLEIGSRDLEIGSRDREIIIWGSGDRKSGSRDHHVEISRSPSRDLNIWELYQDLEIICQDRKKVKLLPRSGDPEMIISRSQHPISRSRDDYLKILTSYLEILKYHLKILTSYLEISRSWDRILR